jgi:hypothetical protein
MRDRDHDQCPTECWLASGVQCNYGQSGYNQLMGQVKGFRDPAGIAEIDQAPKPEDDYRCQDAQCNLHYYIQLITQCVFFI